MDYAKDLNNGTIVTAERASSWHSYCCPRPECGGRVYLAKGHVQRAHFRHYPGEGSSACEEYFPGSGSHVNVVDQPPLDVEDEPASLGLVLSEVEGQWTVGLRLPEIPPEEFGHLGLAALRGALIEVYAGPHRHTKMSALELRPGVHAARVAVPPGLQQYRTQPVGTWPETIDSNRWRLQARGLGALGTLFRLRQGEWTRLLGGSGVHLGETLMLLADSRCPPPVSVPSIRQFETPAIGMQWSYWEVRVPDDVARAGEWLAALGHALAPRPWRLTLVTPARAFTDNGYPTFWLGDVATLKLDAPRHSLEATTVVFAFDSSRYITPVTTASDGTSYLAIDVPRPGLVRLGIGADARSSIELQFVTRPPLSHLECTAIPRLRIRIGEEHLSAWTNSRYALRIRPSAPPAVHADLAHDAARASVTFWQRGSRRSRPGLSARDLATTLEQLLCADGVSLIEVDAGGLGRVEIAPTNVESSLAAAPPGPGRLDWWHLVRSSLSQPSEVSVCARLGLPGHPQACVVRPVGPASLVRSRLQARARTGRGDSRR